MDQDTEKRLENIEKMVMDNHRMLKKLRRAQIYASIWRTIYWAVIIGSAIGAYYYLQPYIEQYKTLYDKIGNQAQSVSNFFGSGQTNTAK